MDNFPVKSQVKIAKRDVDDLRNLLIEYLDPTPLVI